MDSGAATRESGFHSFLTQFIGWQLPLVARYDGTDSPLYLEAIFPMLFVEQKRGWSTIQGPFPTYLRIQDVARRVMEFLLDLEAARNRRRRAELRGAITDFVSKWVALRKSLEGQASRIGRIRGVLAHPTAEFAIASSIRLELFYESEWTPLPEVIALVSARLANLEGAQLETVEEAAPAVEARVQALASKVAELSAVIEVLRNEYGAQALDERALEARVKSLEADLKRNQDAQKLQRLGSELGRAAAEHVCPTCHQSVSSELLPAVESVGMGLEENILFVKSQIELYESTLWSARERTPGRRRAYSGHRPRS